MHLCLYIHIGINFLACYIDFFLKNAQQLGRFGPSVEYVLVDISEGVWDEWVALERAWGNSPGRPQYTLHLHQLQLLHHQKLPFYLDHIGQSQPRCATAKTTYPYNSYVFPLAWEWHTMHVQNLAVDKSLVISYWPRDPKKKSWTKMIYEPDVAQNPDTGGGVQSAKEGSQQPPLVTCGDSCAQKLSTKMHRNANSEQFGKNAP